MRKNLFNCAKLLFVGLAFAVVGCSDYDEDIKDLNNRIDQEIIAGKIDPLKMDLEKAVADLTAAQNALETEIKAAHKEDIDALKASDETLKSAIAEANAAIVALKGDLNAVEAALNAKIDGVEDNLEAKIEEATANLDAKIAEANEKIAAANALIAGLTEDVAALKTKDAEFEKELADLNSELASLNTKLDNELAALETELKALIEANANNIATNKDDIAANKANIAANLAKIEALQADLTSAVDAFTTFKGAVEGQIAELQIKDMKTDAAIAEIKNSIKKLQDTKLDITDFEAYKTEVEGEFMAVYMAISKLQAKDTELSNALKKAKEDLQAQLDEAFAKIGANAEAIAALQGEVDANKAAIAANSTAIAGVVADLAKEIENREAADKAISDELTAKIDGVAADLAQAVADLNAADDALKAEDEALKAQDEALQALIEALGVKVDQNKEELQKEIAKKYKELAAKDADLAEWIAKVSGTVDKNAVRIDKLEAKDAEFQKAFEEFKESVAEQILAIQKVDGEQNDRLDAAEGRLTLSEEAIKALQEKDAALDKTIEELQAAIAAAQVDINKLAARVQSIVYVPDYSDGKATVNVAKLMTTSTNDNGEAVTTVAKFIEAASTIQYQIYPANCAEGIVALWQDDNSILAFNLAGNLKAPASRSGETTEVADPALNIRKVELANAAEGIIEITFEARGLGDQFYNGNNDYSASLVLNYDGYTNEENNIAQGQANLSSCYTNLAPANNKAKVISVKLVPAAPTELDSIAIPYTKRNSTAALEEYETKALLNGSNVRYVIGNDEYSYAQMIDSGYAVEAPVFSYSVAGYAADGTESEDVINLFSCDTLYSPIDPKKVTVLKTDEEFVAKNDLQAWVGLTKEAVAETVGSYIIYSATYNVMGEELAAQQKVVVAPHSVKLSATVDDIVWNYSDDAEQDAEQDDAHYVRNSLVLKFAATNEELEKELDGVKLADVIKTSAQSLQVSIDSGKTYKTPSTYLCYNNTDEADDSRHKLTLTNKDGNVIMHSFAGFEWNKEYKVKYTYRKHKSVNVEIYVDVKTIDRTREVIKIEQTADVELYKNITFKAFAETNPTAVMDLGAIYDSITYDRPEKDAFLTEVLGNNERAYTVTSTTVVASATDVEPIEKTIEDDWTTNFKVDNNAYTASVGFSYASFDIIPNKAVYTKKITLWYGQEVELVYTVNFTEPKLGYDFIANPLWVFEPETGGYASQVQGRYNVHVGEPNKATLALTKFDVENIDMEQAFYVVDAERLKAAGDPVDVEKISPFNTTQLNSLGLVIEFDFVKSAEDSIEDGIIFNGNVITYNGKNASVPVNGKLFLQHENGAKLELTTSFSEGGKYYNNYSVLKFDPFTAITANDYTCNITEVKKYNIKVLSLFDMFESRLGDGNATVLGTDANGEEIKVDLFNADGSSFKGTSQNGWFNNYTIKHVYPSVETEYSNVKVEIPDMYENAISWENGVLTFDNTPNMQLQKDVVIPITLTVNYTWGSKSATANVTFTNPELKK